MRIGIFAEASGAPDALKAPGTEPPVSQRSLE